MHVLHLRGDVILAALTLMGFSMIGASSGVLDRRLSWLLCVVGLMLSVVLILAAVQRRSLP